MAGLPLEGVTVLDLGQIYAGPYATLLMAMAGADIIKIEPPKTGENLRGRGQSNAALPFVMLNRNKKGMTLNLKDPRGRDILIELAKRADVLVENYAAGVMDRLGCGWPVLHEVNPRLIYGSSTGYGLSGPKRDLLAMDLTVQAMSGVISVTGFPEHPPVKAGPAVSDFAAGTHLYAGIMAALYERERTGLGRLVEVSMFEATLPSLSSSFAYWYASGGKAPPRTGNHHSSLAEAPYNVYATKDGYVTIICVTEGHWAALCDAMERPELTHDERFKDRHSRVRNIEVLDNMINDWMSTWSRDDMMDRLTECGVPSAPVRDLLEVIDDPHLHERGALRWIEHPELGHVVVPASAIRYDNSTFPEPVPSPSIGQDNREILREWLGMGATDIDVLEKEGVL